MATKSNLRVEVTEDETEVIEETLTNKNEDRIFGVGNGEKTIIATVMGSDDGQNWVIEISREIAPLQYSELIAGATHVPRVKLLARTKNPGQISKVDGYLNYSEP